MLPLGELYLLVRVRQSFLVNWCQRGVVRELTEKSTRGVFALYLVRSRKIGDKQPTWSVCRPVMRLKDFREASQLKRE